MAAGISIVIGRGALLAAARLFAGVLPHTRTLSTAHSSGSVKRS